MVGSTASLRVLVYYMLKTPSCLVRLRREMSGHTVLRVSADTCVTLLASVCQQYLGSCLEVNLICNARVMFSFLRCFSSVLPSRLPLSTFSGVCSDHGLDTTRSPTTIAWPASASA